MTNNLLKIILGGIVLIILTAGGVLAYNHFTKEIIGDTTPLKDSEIDELYDAIINGDITTYSKYVNDGAKLSFAFEDKTTPLEKIIEANDLLNASKIINSGFDLTKVDNNHIDTVSNIIAYNETYNIPMVNEVIITLVEQIKDEIESEDSYGYSLLINAIENNNDVLVDEILKYIKNVNLEYTPLKDGERLEAKTTTALLYACSNSKNLEIIKKLVAKGANVNYQGEYGESCIMKAIDNLNFVSYLVTIPSLDINMQNDLGQTVLHLCVENENIEALDIILQNKNVNKEIQDEDGFTAKEYAEYLGLDDEFLDKL